MLMNESNDFGAEMLNLNLIKTGNFSPLDFDQVNKNIYAESDSFDTGNLAGLSFNICGNNNASVYFDFDGGLSLLIRINGIFEVAATFDSTGESESDIDAAYCAISLRD